MCSCQFPHMGFFDLIRLNEALDNRLTSTEADRDTLLQTYGRLQLYDQPRANTRTQGLVVFSQDYYRVNGTAV